MDFNPTNGLRYDPLDAQRAKIYPTDFVDASTANGCGLGGKLSNGAKRLFSFLHRFAITVDRRKNTWNGYVFPEQDFIATRLGMSSREVRRCQKELVSTKVLSVERPDRHRNRYLFIWHPKFQAKSRLTGVDPKLASDVDERTNQGGTTGPIGHDDRTNRVSLYKEDPHSDPLSHSLKDTDCSPKRKTGAPANLWGRDQKPPSKAKPHPRLRAALQNYMSVPGERKRDPPTDRQVVDIIEAARNVSDEQIIAILHFLYEERGLKPNTRNGPRSYKWFETLLLDYYTKWDAREESAHPWGFEQWKERNDVKEGWSDGF